MKKEKIVYIIPGFGESHLKQKGYDKVAKIFEKNHIIPVHTKIDWMKTKPFKFSNYIEQFLRQYKKSRNMEVYILGFSYGATIAFLTANKTKPESLILCSLSPFFKEDLKNLKPSVVSWWRKNFVESDYSFTKLAPKIKSKVYLIVGGKEIKPCLIRARDAKRKLKNSRLNIAKRAAHRIGQKEYLATVQKVISKL